MKEWHDSMLAEPPKTPKKVHNKNASQVSLESLDDIEAQKEIEKPPKSKEGRRRRRNEPTTCSCDDPLVRAFGMGYGTSHFANAR